MTATWLAVCGTSASAQESAPAESRPASAPSADDPADVAAICDLLEEARDLIVEGEFESADESVIRATERRRAILRQEHESVARALLAVGAAYARAQRFREALASSEAALAALRRVDPKDRPKTATALNNVAVCLTHLGRSKDALRRLEEALAMRRRLDPIDGMDVAANLQNAASCLMRLGRAAEALPRLVEALELHERLGVGDDSEVATTLDTLGACHEALGRLSDALAAHEAALSMRRRLGSGADPEVARSLSNTATCMIGLGRADEGFGRLESALALWDRVVVGDHHDKAACLGNLGDCLVRLGRASEAIPRFEAALAMTERLFPGDHPQKTVALHNLAYGLFVSGRPTDSLRLSEAAFAMAKRQGFPDAPVIGRRLARTSAATGDLRRAAESMEEAAAQFEARRSDAARLAEGDRVAYERRLGGRDYHRELSDLRRRLGEPEAAFEAMERGRGRAALDLLARARTDLVATARRRAVEQGRMQDAAAIDATEEAITTVEEELTTLAFEERTVASRRDLDASSKTAALATIAAQAGELRRALRARLGDRARRIADILPPGRPARLGEARASLAEGDRLAAYVVGSEESYLMLLAPHRAEVMLLTLKWPEGGAVTLSGLSDAVDGYLNELAAEGMRAGNRGVDVAEAPASRGVGAAARHGRRLFGALMPDEVWREIRGAARVEILPDGPLHRLPFEALVVDDGPSVAARRYWIDDGPSITYAASVSTNIEARRLRDARTPTPVAYAVLAVGDPTWTSTKDAATRPTPSDSAGAALAARHGGLAPLPGTRREIEAIARIVEGFEDPTFGRLKARALLGSDATESRVYAEAPRARILHLATHYLAEETDDGSFSALALTPPAAPDREDDGFLRIYDVVERWRDRLSATDLVVLSACESKGGRGDLDDGVYAMPIALLFAGVPSVISSLWRVEDQSTADLMSDFYRRLFDPAVNAATADRPAPTRLEHFTAARKAARARRPEPYFWAPFVWMGDPR